MYDTSSQPIEMQERYKELPVEITDLFEYDIVGVVVNKIATEFGLNEDQVAALTMEIEMVLYLFMTRDDFTERLQESLEIEGERAKGITQRVVSDLFVIVEPILDIADTERKKNESIVLNIENEAIAPTTTNSPNSNVAEAQSQPPEKQIPDLKPIRTFTEDVNLSRAHGYGAFRSDNSTTTEENDVVHRSSQDDIIGK